MIQNSLPAPHAHSSEQNNILDLPLHLQEMHLAFIQPHLTSCNIESGAGFNLS